MNSFVFAAAIAAFGCSAAEATTLVDLVDAPSQAGTHYSFTLTATSGSTTISFAGYEVMNDEYAETIALSNALGTNLLSSPWTFVPAASGSSADQSGDGAGLHFGGTTDGSYDTFSQSAATTPGATYTLTFGFSNYASTQNGFRVTTDAAIAAVPEAATWAMMVLGFGIAGAGLRRRNRAAIRFA